MSGATASNDPPDPDKEQAEDAKTAARKALLDPELAKPAKPARAPAPPAAAPPAKATPQPKADPKARRKPPAAAASLSHTEVFGFEMRPGGLFMLARQEGKGDLLVSGPFEVLAAGRDGESEGWGLLLRWRDRTKAEHEFFMPRAMLAGEATELRARLADGGLYVSAAPAARAALLDFLSRQDPPDLVRTTEAFGWIIEEAGAAYVMSSAVIGELAGERIVVTGASRAAKRRFARRGTLAAWKKDVAALCIGNSRLLLAVSLSFAATLLTPLDEETGGVNLRANSQRGKSTAAKVAGSVWGRPEGRGAFICRWRASDNGLEAMAADFNDCAMILDELGQADLKHLGASIYMLGNEQGKIRSDRSARAREATSWRLLFLSTGERTLAEMIAASGHNMSAGQEVRMIDVPGDAGRGLGVFEELHDAGEAGNFAEQLKRAALAQYGTAGPAFVAWVAEKLRKEDDWCERMVAPRIGDFLEEYLPEGADGQVRSVARRLAVIAIGGELATQAGITGWPARAAWEAGGACFAAWLDERGSATGREELAAVSQVRGFIEKHGQARFEIFPDRGSDEASADPAREGGGPVGPPVERRVVMNRAGWRRWSADPSQRGGGVWTYLFNSTGWKEALEGINLRAAGQILHAAGYLLSAQGGKWSKTVDVPGHGVGRFYVVSADILAGDD